MLQVTIFDSLEISGIFCFGNAWEMAEKVWLYWKSAVKLVSKLKLTLVELADQINQKLIYWINVLKIQVI